MSLYINACVINTRDKTTLSDICDWLSVVLFMSSCAIDCKVLLLFMTVFKEGC